MNHIQKGTSMKHHFERFSDYCFFVQLLNCSFVRLFECFPVLSSFRVRHSSSAGGKIRIFTLIELLIVIAIIAILAGMLLPALNSAREKGKTITCLNQVKQVLLAHYAYADDYNGVIPVNAGDPVTRKSVMWAYLISGQNKSTEAPTGNVYVPMKVLTCPKDTKLPKNTSAAKTTVWAGIYGMLHMDDAQYGLTKDASGKTIKDKCGDFRINNGGYLTVYYPHRMRSSGGIPLIADSVTFIDTYYGQGSYRFNPWKNSSSYDEGVCLRHNGRSVIGFADGHAASMSASEMFANRPMNITHTVLQR